MSNYSAAVLADTPTVYYRLNDSSGTVAADSSGNSHPGVLSGVTSYSQTGAITGDTDNSILFTAGGGVALPVSLAALHSSRSAATLEYWMNVTSGWQHIVIAIDATSTIIYVNGTVYTTGSGSENVVTQLSLWWSGIYAAAYLDEVAVYATKLSATRVLAHYNATGSTQAGTLDSDTFTRANQSQWGTASGGNTWAFTGATQATIASIASNVGKATGSTTLTTAFLGSGTSADMIVQARVLSDHTGGHAGIIGRCTGTTTYYRTEISGGNAISITKVVAGVSTDIATGTFNYLTTDLVWLKLYLQGTNISCKVWKTGTAEPGAYTLTTTDSAITAAGQWGVKMKLNTVTDIITFDSFTVTSFNKALIATTEATYKTNMVLGSIAHDTYKTRTSFRSLSANHFLIKNLTHTVSDSFPFAVDGYDVFIQLLG